MNPLLIGEVLTIGRSLIQRLFPDPEQRAKAELELIKLQQDGELKATEVRLSAIVSEAQSQDKWTSRARPSFMYVMYVMILTSIPMGVLHAFMPDVSISIAEGMRAWLAAIPEEMWWLFGVGYSGYTVFRTAEKVMKKPK